MSRSETLKRALVREAWRDLRMSPYFGGDAKGKRDGWESGGRSQRPASHRSARGAAMGASRRRNPCKSPVSDGAAAAPPCILIRNHLRNNLNKKLCNSCPHTPSLGSFPPAAARTPQATTAGSGRASHRDNSVPEVWLNVVRDGGAAAWVSGLLAHGQAHGAAACQHVITTGIGMESARMQK
eukprot:320083-Chlamydomonas_euryale.AAC.2